MTKIYFLDGGTFTQDQSIVTFAIGAGRPNISQVSSVFIDHPEAKIIIETGMDSTVWPDLVKQILVPHQTKEQRLDNALNRIGTKPEEIDIVINTHLHADHCSFNRIFRNATWIIQRKELMEALVPEVHELTYVKACFDVGLSTKLLDGNYEVVKGVHIFDTHGHTAGHQSVAVETEKSGVFLVTGDASMSKDNFPGESKISPQGWPCSPILDAKAHMRSLERLKEYVDTTRARLHRTCTLVYGHDNEEFKKLKQAPSYYE
ncbi:MAG TPA: N-acyl homoserine lactonase family protein [Nitrososphaerales archaeon]|nr:N-acyl homoserine lactonase family protein [Nitrososphaerales archaeon]